MKKLDFKQKNTAFGSAVSAAFYLCRSPIYQRKKPKEAKELSFHLVKRRILL
jgi:hypothetical protein